MTIKFEEIEPGKWYPLSDVQYNIGEIEVLGFNEDWKNLDVNPDGVRVCCCIHDIEVEDWEDDKEFWLSAYWSGCQDAYMTCEGEAPTHIMKIPRTNNIKP